MHKKGIEWKADEKKKRYRHSKPLQSFCFMEGQLKSKFCHLSLSWWIQPLSITHEPVVLALEQMQLWHWSLSPPEEKTLLPSSVGTAPLWVPASPGGSCWDRTVALGTLLCCLGFLQFPQFFYLAPSHSKNTASGTG